MLNQEQPNILDKLNKVDHQYLPEMTAVFIEGLAYEHEDDQISAVWSNLLNSGRTLRQGKLRRPPATGEIAPSTPSAMEAFLSIGDGEAIEIRTVPNDKLRFIIGGMSHYFNNIFMGIWGNGSLIRMDKNGSESVRKGIRRIERLIHHGFILIHLVFGYLAESRTAAKHIRLNQLLEQINAVNLSNDGMLDSKTMKSCMRWVAGLSNPARLSRTISRFIEKLLHCIEKEHRVMLTQTAEDDEIQARLLKINTLIKRGFALTEQLKQYAGDKPLVMRRMRMKSLIKHTLNQFELRGKGICLETDLHTQLPDILADRSQLSTVLKHLIANAIDAMPKGGRLNVAAHLLSKETSPERLFMRSGSDYLVVTVSDSGQGMPPRVQSRIFDPFYVGGPKSNRPGLGLAVTSGIIKAHGGYIQVTSRQGRGSTFRIHLPCPFRNKCDGDVDWSGFYRPGRRLVHAVSYAA
ncbi:MAG: ATP-binding protein [Desulfobacteraceae bacterium]|jgi:signal transduction histidine kinase